LLKDPYKPVSTESCFNDGHVFAVDMSFKSLGGKTVFLSVAKESSAGSEQSQWIRALQDESPSERDELQALQQAMDGWMARTSTGGVGTKLLDSKSMRK
jgi:hypothetical protein